MAGVLVLYYSGVGNTKRVAEIITSNISSQYNVDIYSVEKIPDNFSINQYKAIIIGFPTIHSSPAKPILEFLNNIIKLENEVPTYVFTTCGLYSANSLRIFGKRSVVKNMAPIINRSYRCPPIDGMLLVPLLKCLFVDEKNLHQRVKKDSYEFIKLIKMPLRINIPRTKIIVF